MKNINKTNKKSHISPAKRSVAFLLAAASCFSVAALPQSAIGGLVNDIAITADAAVSAKLLFNTDGNPESNRELQVGKYYVSNNQKFVLVFQGDGNLVLYRYDKAKKRAYEALWHTQTHGNSGARCILQADGNFVIYNKNMKPLWNSRSNGNRKAKLYIADDGEVYIYSASAKRKTWTNNVHKGENGGKVEDMIKWACDIANDDSHGYSQAHRYGPDYDCSSLVAAAARAAGFNVASTLTTWGMKNAFTAVGFEWIPWSQIGSSANLKRGDILLDIDTHTEIYLGNNQNVGAHGDKGHPEQGDQTGGEISVGNYYNGYGVSWDGVLRYKG